GDFLALLAPAARDRLLAGSTRHVYPAGAVFYEPGDGPRVFIAHSGLIRVYFVDAEGRQTTVLYAAENSLLGIVNLFGLIPDLHGQAVLDTVTIGIDVRTFQNVIAHDAQTAGALAAYLAARLRKTFDLLTVRTLGSIRERLAYDLLERARVEHRDVGNFVVRATQADLADSIGTSREVASRALTDLRVEGIVETARKSVRISDPMRLARIVRGLIS
ncbi:MAG TPA: Crp/Fnr family transcriptional regulator, partial [Candidatus Dormibacteraeota bacterium]|nr:Crp/Fnr family transcriptional regulator [Candidatus Dormibacteraeota bacterium]